MKLLSHHAWCVEMDRRDNFLPVIEEHAGISLTQNNDVYVQNVESLDIESAREIKDMAQLKPSGEKRIIIVAADFIHPITQNALLKVCEEPPERVVIYIVVPSLELLLPTLRSRVMTLETRGQKKSPHDALVQQILAAPLPLRLTLIEHLYEKGEEKKKGEALHLLHALMRAVAKGDRAQSDPAYFARTTKLLLQAESDLQMHGAMIKLIMEAVVLSL